MLLTRMVEKLGDDLIASADADDPKKARRYQRKPWLWIHHKLGIPLETIKWSRLPEYATHKWDGTKDPLYATLKALTTHRRIGVESGVATGKTFLLACVVLWFLACFRNAEVVTYAPKRDQLEKHLWKEITKLWPKFQRMFPNSGLTHLRIRMIEDSDAWSAYGFTVGVGADEESAVKAQGGHAEHMLFIVEETPGVHSAIMEALLNTAVDDHNLILAVGNPDHQFDTLHSFCTRIPGAKHIRISALDHPNVVCKKKIIPGAVTAISIEEKRLRYGSVKAPLYRSRVRGISPAEARDAIIKLEWCYRARDRGRRLCDALKIDSLEQLWELQTLPAEAGINKLWRAIGVDVANSPDGDKAGLAKGIGHILCVSESMPCEDANMLGHSVAQEARQYKVDEDYIGVDGVGVGVGTVNALKEDGFTVQALMGGASMMLSLDEIFGDEKFKDLRSQMQWLFRLDAQFDRLILPDDEELFQDLVAPKWEPEGKAIKVESKKLFKKRLGRSPDKGDAAVYWNWVRQVRAGTTGGGDMIDI